MRCLILGGSGFLGSHLADALLADGLRIRAFGRSRDRLPEHLRRSTELEFVSGDFTDPRDLETAMDGCQVIFHLVSTSLPKGSNEDPVRDVETNVAGSIRLLDIAVRKGVKQVIFVSSGGTVYGPPQQTPIPETHPTDPITSYGIGKLAVEKYLALYRTLHGLDYRVLRISNLYGERQRTDSAQGAVAVFIDKALRGEEIEIWGDGSVTRDYVYVRDAAQALRAAMAYPGKHRIFNVGSGRGTPINQLLKATEDALKIPLKRRYVPGRTFDVPSNVLDISRARAELRWSPVTSLENGLQLTVEWMRSRR